MYSSNLNLDLNHKFIHTLKSVMVRKVRHYLNHLTKSIERNEERLRMISSTLEHSTSGHTLKRRLSPNNSMGGSINSINALNNSSHNIHNVSNSGVGLNSLSNSISAGNGALHTHQKTISLFGKLIRGNSLFETKMLFNNINLIQIEKGAQSPESYRKLLALSETKVKTVKNSQSSTSMPLSHHLNTSISGRSPRAPSGNGNVMNTSTSSSSVIINNSNSKISTPPSAPLSPKNRSMSSSQSLATGNSSSNTATPITIAETVSMATSVKLNGKYTPDIATGGVTSVGVVNHTTSMGNQNSSMVVKSNTIAGIQQQVPTINGAEADSGRASMASNVDQDQCSPMFHQRAFILNKCKASF
jgi:hypothetical protein